jgi:hypothetical protein
VSVERSCVCVLGRTSILFNRLPLASPLIFLLKDAGLLKTGAPPPPKVYSPQLVTQTRVMHAMDWIARSIEGGQKGFVFPTVDWQSRSLTQTLKSDKTVASGRAHAVETWQRLGLPDFLQLDNASAFNGGGKTFSWWSTSPATTTVPKRETISDAPD